MVQMKTLFLLLILVILTGCATSKDWWDNRSEGEKVAIGVGASLVVTGLIIRNGQGQSQSQCISTRSLETGCPK